MEYKYGITISTYQRPDGKTPFYLKRALDSVFNQKYKNFKIFLIGDKYENEDEINNIVSLYDKEKIFFKNLSYAKERDNYTGWELWSYGGVNAINISVDVALSEGYEFLCHLDHDDYWSEDHLLEINNCIHETKSDWVCTKSRYVSNRVLPSINNPYNYINFLPTPAGLIHSSVCMNFKKIPLKYRDLYEETGKLGLPSDADLWFRVKEYILKNNLKSTLINKVTCIHDEEGYERTRK